jgi:hypothetical protein
MKNGLQVSETLLYEYTLCEIFFTDCTAGATDPCIECPSSWNMSLATYNHLILHLVIISKLFPVQQ